MNLFSLTAEGIKFYNLQQHLEKSINPVLERLQKHTELDLYELSNTLEKERQNEWKLLQTKIKDVLEALRCKMELIKFKELGNITDFKQFKKEMIIIQDNIQNLKYENKKQIGNLEREVNDLSEDVNDYTEKLLEWSEPIQINVIHNVPSQKKSIKNMNCKEVKEFMDFVHASGGHENGWRREDHYLFIKFRNKFKNIDTTAKELHEELPDISIEDIKQHEEWYQKYISLELKKRNALKAWQKEKASKNSLTKYANISAKVTTNVKPSVNIQEKLMKWKTLKEERTETAKQIEKYKKQKRDEMEQLRKKRNEEVKCLVQEWKQKRQHMEEQEILQKRVAEEQDKKQRALEANRMIKQFQSQDDLYILKIKQKKKAEPRPMVRSKSSQSAKRDPKRLLKPTQQWINRVHDETPSVNFGKVVPLKCLPKLGVPEWRKTMN